MYKIVILNSYIYVCNLEQGKYLSLTLPWSYIDIIHSKAC